MKRLWHFKGGIHLPGHKALSAGAAITRMPEPRQVVLPLQQHTGVAAEPLVSVGDTVDKGQPVAAPTTFVSAAVHASVSGRVVAIEKRKMPHPSGIAELCIVIESDGEQRWWKQCNTVDNPDDVSVEQARERIRQAGIVGLGGAVFPSSAKLSPPRAVDTLVINGVECEPYITCDDMLMRERAEDVIHGARLLLRIVGAGRCLIAVEDNKPQAIEALRSACGQFADEATDLDVVAVPTIFPAGGEKQLIKVLTGREVPVGGLPYEVGAVCLNVATTTAVLDAVHRRRPLVSRVVTVTGADVKRPGNYEVPLGVSVKDLLMAAGAPLQPDYDLIMGGPMMGQVLPDASVMVVKGTNCILVRKVEPAVTAGAMPCIRCGSCAEACPMRLLPQQLYWHSRGKNFEELERYDLASCIECGCCAVVCPSHIPLVSYFRFAKTESRAQEVKRLKANEARARNEARQQRLEALEREKALRRKQRGKRGRTTPGTRDGRRKAQGESAERADA